MEKIIYVNNGSTITVYSFTPNVELVRNFRTEEMKKIQKADRFYKAPSNSLLKDFRNGVANHDLIRAYDTDIELSPDENDKEKTRFEPTGFYDKNNHRYERFIDLRIGNGDDEQPFRVKGLNGDPNETDYFLPLTELTGSQDCVFHGILHITREIYLHQLFLSKKWRLLSQSGITDEQLFRIIDLHDFEAYEIRNLAGLGNGEGTPISQRLIKLAEKDKVGVEMFGEYIKKKVNGVK